MTPEAMRGLAIGFGIGILAATPFAILLVNTLLRGHP
jgi:hypothetical protein